MKKIFFSFQKKFIAFSLMAIGVATTVGCSKSFDEDYNQPDVPVAGLMAFNLTTDKTIGISLSGNSLSNTPLEFGSYTGNYLRIYTGERTVEARDGFNGNIIATTPARFDSSRFYSAFTIGANNTYRNVVVNDNFDSLSSTNGQAYVRYINAVPDSTHSATVSISANSGGVNNSSAAYGSVSAFTPIAPGQVTIAINKNGVSKARTINLEQQKVYTFLLLGVPGSNTTDSMQVRHITNGTLSGTNNTNGRTVSGNSQSISIN